MLWTPCLVVEEVNPIQQSLSVSLSPEYGVVLSRMNPLLEICVSDSLKIILLYREKVSSEYYTSAMASGKICSLQIKES
jgi:hypothetical protein